MAEIAGIVLAAGRATRFGGAPGATKLTATDGGQPLVRRAASAALAAGLSPIVVVTGHARAAVVEALAGLTGDEHTIVEAFNARYADGLAGSLRAGLDATPPDVAGAVVLLGDMPRVTPALIAALAAAFAARPDAHAAAPARDGRRGNPVLLGRALFDAARRLEGDVGARALLRSPGVRVADVACADDGAFLDIDTRAALAALTRRD